MTKRGTIMSDSNKKQMKTGIIGTVVAALCCFTPVLVVLFGAIGLSAWLGWIDYVLFPALFASLGLVAHALYLRAGKVGPRPKGFILAGVVIITALLFWLEFRFALRISIAAAAAVAAYAYYLRSAAARRVSPSS
ncbi:MAG: mercury resistance system transport protein MerF [Proteobacteria bacterium]|nr:mercury resistance system transport protein MerF [Pseudomonadota bacterium]MCH7833189.1 mercury resistance system transport protein MerF [Pseudomonadota bacterium]